MFQERCRHLDLVLWVQFKALPRASICCGLAWYNIWYSVCIVLLYMVCTYIIQELWYSRQYGMDLLHGIIIYDIWYPIVL